MAKLITADGDILFTVGDVSGDVVFSDDVAIDGILLVGDGAAQVGSETLGVAGDGYFSGSVGIKVSPLTGSFSSELQVNSTGSIYPASLGINDASTSIGSGVGALELHNDNSTDDNWIRVFFTPEAKGSAVGMMGMQVTDHALGYGRYAWALRDGGGFSERMDLNGDVLTIKEFKATNLPTSNPGGSGIVWNNSGVLNIT